jgi:hypothetical protein
MFEMLDWVFGEKKKLFEVKRRKCKNLLHFMGFYKILKNKFYKLKLLLSS